MKIIEDWLINKFITVCKQINPEVTNDIAYEALKIIRRNKA